MKKMTMIFLTLFSGVALSKISVLDLYEKSYQIEGDDIYYKASVTLTEVMGLPVVRFVEHMGVDFECRGLFHIDNGNELTSNMFCGDISDLDAYQKLMAGETPDFTQVINLPQETDLSQSFKATVKSTLYDNIPLSFTFTPQ